MGIKPRTNSDPARAISHRAGAGVTILHHVEHQAYGTLGIPRRRFWANHANIAIRAAEEFEALHPRVLEAPVGSSGTRIVTDAELLFDLYRTGVECVLNAVISVQYLCEEIEQTLGLPVFHGALRDRLHKATLRAGLSDVHRVAGYDEFIELAKVRDAIEHPKPATVFASIYEWDQVPFSWMLGGGLVRAFAGFSSWYEALGDDWIAFLARRGQQEVTLTVRRGAGSSRPFKKPPKT